MLIGFVILGSTGGAIGALGALLLDASLMLVALSYSLTGTLTVLAASTVFVILSGRRCQQDDHTLAKHGYRFE